MLCAFLLNEALHAEVRATQPLPGMEGFMVVVPMDEVRRAMEVLTSIPDFDEAELIELATGEKPTPEELLDLEVLEVLEGVDPSGFEGDDASHRRRTGRRRKRKRR